MKNHHRDHTHHHRYDSFILPSSSPSYLSLRSPHPILLVPFLFPFPSFPPYPPNQPQINPNSTSTSTPQHPTHLLISQPIIPLLLPRPPSSLPALSPSNRIQRSNPIINQHGPLRLTAFTHDDMTYVPPFTLAIDVVVVVGGGGGGGGGWDGVETPCLNFLGGVCQRLIRVGCGRERRGWRGEGEREEMKGGSGLGAGGEGGRGGIYM